MTDKEIIIDGIDVSECKHFENTDNEMGCSLTCCRGCRTYNDCYFKQLKRKEQECEKYKQVLDEIEELVRNYDDWDLLKDISDIINKTKEQ